MENKLRSVSTSSHTLFWISLAAEMKQQYFSFILLLMRKVGLGQWAWPFGRWWWHEFCVRVHMMLSLLSLSRGSTSVDELKQHLLGDRI